MSLRINSHHLLKGFRELSKLEQLVNSGAAALQGVFGFV